MLLLLGLKGSNSPYFFAPIFFKKDQTFMTLAYNSQWILQSTDLLALLESLPTLPDAVAGKKHPTINYPNDILNTATSRAIIQQHMRITGCCVTRSDFGSKTGPSGPNTWNATTFALAQEVGVTDLCIATHPILLDAPDDDSSFTC